MDSQHLRHLSRPYRALEYSIETHDIICIHGQPQVGKTTLVKEFFEANPEFIQVYFDCHLISSTSDLYIGILRELNVKLNINVKDKEVPSKIIGVDDFRDRIEDLSAKAERRSQDDCEKTVRFYVILDNVHYWKKSFILDCIVAIEKSSSSLTPILISDENIFHLMDHMKSVFNRSRIQDNTINIEIPSWEKIDIQNVILRCKPQNHVAMYELFVANAVPVLYPKETKNFASIRNCCQSNFQGFLEYYQHEVHKLDKKTLTMTGKKLDDYCLKRLPHIIQRLTFQFMDLLKGGSKLKDSTATYDELYKDREVNLNLGVLIVALFVAAYTNSSDDRRNFVRYQKKLKTRKTRARAEDEENVSRTFTMERVIQIYKQLSEFSKPCEDQDDQSSQGIDVANQTYLPDSVLSDLKFLQDLKIIKIYAGDGLDSLTRYKIGSHITRDYVERIAQQVDLSLNQIYGLSL